MKLCGKVNWCKKIWLIIIIILPAFSYHTFAQNINLPPVLDVGVSNQHAEVNSPFSYTIPHNAFKDENNDLLTYTVSNLPAWLTYNAANRTLTGTPTTATSTPHTITVNVSDGTHSRSTTFTIKVHPVNATYAAFTMNTQMGCNFRSISFINLSKGVIGNSYEWDFGNGDAPSSVENPNVIFNQPGNYTVRLTINKNQANERTHTENIKIYPRPIPVIRDISGGCEPHAATLISEGSPANVNAINGGAEEYYSWHVSGIPGHYTLSNETTATPLPAGDYRVNLRVMDQYGCYQQNTQSAPLKVFEKPTAQFIYSKANSCSPSTTTFIDKTPLSDGYITNYNWSVDGQNQGVNNDTLIYNFTQAGEYVVSLQNTSSNGCVSDTYSQTITFNSDNSADFNIESHYCLNQTIELSANTTSGATEYSWDIGNNGTIDNRSQTFSHELTTSGSYPVKLTTLFNDGCKRDVIKTLNVEELNVDFNHEIQYDCLEQKFQVSFTGQVSSNIGNPIQSYQWYLVTATTETLISNSQSFNHTFNQSGTRTIKLKAHSSTGCFEEIEKTIQLQRPALNISLGGDYIGCNNSQNITFEANFSSQFETATGYTWNFGDGSTGSGKSTTHIYNNPGDYDISVIVNTSSGCIYNASLENAVKLANPPVITGVDVIQDGNKCFSQGVNLNIHYTGNPDYIRINAPGGIHEILEPEVSPEPFFYEPVDTGYIDFSVVASRYGCESAVFELFDYVRVNEPIAKFTPSQNPYCNDPPFLATFDNQSKYKDLETTFTWNFGDGNEVTYNTSESPSHEYSQTGNYWVTLTVTNTNTGCSDTYTDEISIYLFDEAENIITADKTTGCAPFTVNFNQNFSSSIEGDNYNPGDLVWHFIKNGEVIDVITSPESNVQYTFQSPGQYSVRVFEESGGCNFNILKENFIQASGPIVNFGYTPQQVCIDTEISFNGVISKPAFDTAEPISFFWDFGDGQTANTRNATHAYSQPDTFSVSYTVTDSRGCTTTLQKPDLFEIISFEPDFELSDSIFCSNSVVEITNTSSGKIISYHWDFEGNGSTDFITTNPQAEVTHEYSIPGKYNITLTAIASDGCEKSFEKEIRIIDASPQFETAKENIGCAPSIAHFYPLAEHDDVISYFWNFGDGNTSTEREPENMYLLPGSYSVSLTVVFKGGCTRQITRNNLIKVDGAYGELVYDNTPGCAPYEVNLRMRNMSRVDYIDWYFGTGEIKRDTVTGSATTADIYYTYDTLGYRTPKVILTDLVCGEYEYSNDALGAIYTSTPPDVDFISDYDTICQGAPLQFTDKSSSPDPLYEIESWEWDFGTTVHSSSSEQNPTFAYNNQGIYSPALTVSNTLGCSNTIEKPNSIHIIRNDVTSAFDLTHQNGFICPWQTVQVTSLAETGVRSQITKYEWDFGEGFTTGGIQSNHRYSSDKKGQTVTITHRVTDDNFCIDSTLRTVEISNLQAAFDYDPQPVFRGSTVDYSDQSITDAGTQINQWKWDFGGGQPQQSNNQNPQNILYANILENNPLSLIVTNSITCTDTILYTFDVLNNPPTVIDFEILLVENRSYEFSPHEFEVNFIANDPGQNLEYIRIEQLPNNGTLYIDDTQLSINSPISYNDIDQLKFIPHADWNGTTHCTWNGFDGHGWSNIPANLTITVIQNPEPPILSNIRIEAFKDETVNLNREQFIQNMNTILGSSFDFDSLSILKASTPSYAGTLHFNEQPIAGYPLLITSETIDGNNNFLSFHPQQNYQGHVEFTWNAYDGYNFADNPAKVIINYINQAPVAVNDTFTVYENFDQVTHLTEGNSNVLDNDYDPDIHDNFTIHRVNGGLARTVQGANAYGSFTWHTSGTWTFRENYAETQKLAGGQIAEEIFRYTITDGSDISQEAYIVFRIIGRNNPPTAINDTIRITENDAQTAFNALANDFDIDQGDSIGMTLVNEQTASPVESEYGWLEWDSEGNCLFELNEGLYTLSAGQSVIAEYNYTISDDSLSTDNAKIVIIISGINNPPLAQNDTLFVSENDISHSPQWSLLDNDYDVDSEYIAVSRFNRINRSPVNTLYASFEWDFDGFITYNRYVHSDPRMGIDTLAHGEIVIDEIPYTIRDTEGETDEAFLILVITGENDPPVAVPDSVSVYQNAIRFESTESILANDYDVDRGDSISLLNIKNNTSGSINGTYGRLEWDNYGHYTYHIDNDATASIPRDAYVLDKFPYTISDRMGARDTDTLTITIIGVNYPPTAIDVAVHINEKEKIKEIYPEANGLLINSFDIDGDSIFLVLPQNEDSWIYTGIYGELEVHSNGQATYFMNDELDSLKLGEQVTDIFPFTVSDSNNTTNDADLSVIITGRNDPPVAADVFFSIYEDSLSVSVAANSQYGLLSNAYDIDDDGMRVREVDTSSGQYGEIEWHENGSYTFINNREMTRTIPMGDTAYQVFNFVISDIHGASDEATLTIEIIGINNPPLAAPMFYATMDVNPIVIETGSDSVMMAESVDYDGYIEKVTEIEGTSNDTIEGKYGILIWKPDGSFVYLPDSSQVIVLKPGETIHEQFPFTIIDNHGAPATDTLYFSIEGINYAPIAQDIVLWFRGDSLHTPHGINLLDKAYDPEGDTIRVFKIADDENEGLITHHYGELFWKPDGEIVFAPRDSTVRALGPREQQTVIFTFTIEDEPGAQATAKITIRLVGENDPLIAENDTITIEEDSYAIYDINDKVSDPDDNIDYGSLTIEQHPVNGRAYINSANGTIYYYPNENFFGLDSLKYRICDEGFPIYCDTAWLFIEVTPVNDPPVATHLLLHTNINTPVDFNAVNQVHDIDDGVNPASLQIINQPEDGFVQWNNDSTLTYTPDSAFTGINEFIYSLSDFEGESAYVIVNVIVQDNGRGAQDDYATTAQRTPIDIFILENDTLNGFRPNPLSADIKVFPLNGTASYNPRERALNYRPNDNFNGTDSLYYIVQSYTDNFDYAKVVLTVEPINKPIVANNDAATTYIDTPIEIRILENDYDLDDGIDTSSVQIITVPQNGKVTYNSQTGRAHYTPDTGFKGADSFKYSVCDLNENPSCDTATVFILVRSEYSELNAKNDYYYIPGENEPFELTPHHPIDNDTYNDETIDISLLTKIISEPVHGTYQIDVESNITYIPAENYNGPDWMTYEICLDDICDYAEINFWIEPQNTAPVATDDYYVVNENSSRRLYILANDYDIDGYLDWATLDTVSGMGPRKGTIEFDRLTGTIIYQPLTNTDIDQFIYTICDNEGACDDAVVTIDIDLGNIIFYDIFTLEDTPYTFDIQPLLAEYNLYFEVNEAIENTSPSIGLWELINNNTQITYTPGDDLNGEDYFNVHLFSEDDIMADLRVNVWVEPVNDPPVAMPDTVIWNMDSNSTTTTFQHLLKNDYDVDGDPIIITIGAIDNAEQFEISFDPSDSTIIIFTNEMDWCNAWFIYEISDPDGLTDTAMVHIFPDSIHYKLEAVDDFYDHILMTNILTPDESMSHALSVLENDKVLDDQICTIDSLFILTPPLFGNATVNTDKEVVYTPESYYYSLDKGLDSLQYLITDIWGGIDSAWVVIDVQFQNIPPVANDDIQILEPGGITIIDILNNDYDPDPYPFGYIDTVKTYINEAPQNGTAIFDLETGILTYISDGLSCESDWLSYTIFDNHGDSATATVYINAPEEWPLYPVADTVKTWPGVPVEFNVLANDSGYFLPWVSDYTNPTQGWVEQLGDSSFVFHPDPSFMENDQMTYQLVSPCGNSATGNVIFIIEELRVPEIITPNNDGKNDALIIDGIEYFPDSWLRIFNRYGHVVYQKRGYDNSWDGYSNQGSLGGNRPLPSGTYHYTLIYNDGLNHQAGIIYIFR